METGQQALILFYAFFWAAALNMTGRYQSFDTPSMWAGNKHAWRRFIVSILLLNILPIIWLVILYFSPFIYKEGITSIIAAAFASLSVFGFHRILHACIASENNYRWFYTTEQVSEVRNRDRFNQPQNFAAHFIPGLLYFVIFGIVAWLIGK